MYYGQALLLPVLVIVAADNSGTLSLVYFIEEHEIVLLLKAVFPYLLGRSAETSI